MTQTSLNEMSREQWLQWRRRGIGSSDAASIMGESPWRTPYQTWEDKVFGSSQADNAAMKRGRDYEQEARECFEKKMNTLVFPINVIHPEHDWIRASLDGLDLDEKIMVEIKVPGRDDHFSASLQKVPDKYFVQCQHQLSTKPNLSGMYYFSYDPNAKDGHIVEIARDAAYLKEQLFPKEKEFWEMVLGETPPPFTEKDYIDREDNPEWLRLTSRLREINPLIKEHDELREALKAIAAGHNSKGNGVAFTKSICKGTIDYKRAFEDHKISLEDYRKEAYIKWSLRDM
jgi:putative phage-type endonuclease